VTVPFEAALATVETAAGILFDGDPSIRSVGVGAATEGFSYVAVRNARTAVPLSARAGLSVPRQIEGVPVRLLNSFNDPVTLARVPHSGPASPGIGSLIPEQQPHPSLVRGLQIQNFDEDNRSGEIAAGFMTVGTLGCFVQLSNGDPAILSNNHVVAGENAGQPGDSILQPGSATPAAASARLTHFVRLQPSPPGASIAAGNVIFNDVDAGVAALNTGLQHTQGYLPARSAVAPRGVAVASVNDLVHKVGRTTGLTFGRVTQVGVVLPVAYKPGQCWFRQIIAIEGLNGTTFSDHGDSGSAIVRDDGMVVGLLFAGNGTQTYACAIDNVLNQLICTMI
jgi:hypothetical protein